MIKKLLLFAGIVLFAASMANAQKLEENAEAGKSYNEGNKLRNQGNYAGAVEKYDEALKSSKDYRIYYQKGVTLKSLNKYEDAEKTLLECAKQKPDFDLVYNALGSTYYADNKFLEAVENFKKFGELTKKKDLKKKADENISRSYAKLGLNAKNDGNYEKSIEYLSEAVKFMDYDAAYLALAQVYIESGKYDQGLEAADKAINYRKSISKGGPYYFKGLAFKNKNDKTKAIENFELAKADPQYKATSEYELKLLK
ncbi:MAG: hypothetical protein K9I69_06320 [Ignavibacteriales bacterium]|nr:hypothetical protein [Ignavibacteriales bacterium]MCF8305382.1 hypothetical protein [Ignavibacteriales bacterium]MCF8316065.1 hypothetical protein [Ignavibacteriales bacterium]MCF8436567.1 hypothetical protein [Ignavibacteriales bacterium]